MGDHQGGDPLLDEDLAQLGAQRCARRGVERGQRLVEQEQCRLGRQRARERHALGLSARQLGHWARGEVPCVCCTQGVLHPRDPLGSRQGPQAEGDVGGDIQMGEQRMVLEQVADASAPGWHDHASPLAPTCPGEVDGSLVERLEAGEAAQERGLARTGGTEQHGHG
jgi:hypothetical protein